jgi:hypothetical protein
VRQTANTKDTKEQVVAGVVDFTPLESDKAESGDKESLSRVVQAKMAVSSPSDPFEVEAEKVAADFVKRSYDPGSGGGVGISRSITPLVARRASGDGLENSGAGLETSADAAQKISRATASGGRPLDGATRSRFEDGLGADLSAVKVHTDSSSDTLCRSLSADAFSTGRDVFFSSGTFNPGTKSGDHLLAHELTHVVQQGAAPTIARSKAAPSAGQAEEGSVFRLTVGRANDPSEDLADAMADDAVASLRRSASRPGTVHRKAADPKDPLGGTQVDDGIERSINSQRGKGAKLGDREATHFSESYGTDLSGVRVHTDSTADSLSRSLQADAFTTGSDIFFRQGTYKPGTSDGDHLIGHELAHVATEGGGAQRSIRREGMVSGALGLGPPDPKASALLAEQYNMSKLKRMVDKNTFWTAVNTTWTDKPPQIKTIWTSIEEYNNLQKKDPAALQKVRWPEALKILDKIDKDLSAYEAGPKEKDDAVRKAVLTDWRIAMKDLRLRFVDLNAASAAGAERLRVEAEKAKVAAELEEAEKKTPWEKLKDLVYSAVQDKIDTIEAELKISIPVSAGISMPVVMKASVELGEDDEGVGMRVSFETGASGGSGVKLTALLGGYLEAKGKDIAMATDLLGYAFYRRLAESNAPAEIEAYMFGGKEGTRESASARMGELEKLAFGDEDSEWYAESGVSGSVELEVEGLEMKVSGGGTAGTRTDRKSILASGTEIGGKKAKAEGSNYNPADWIATGANWAFNADRGREKSIGRSTAGMSVKGELSSPFEASIAYDSKWLEDEKGVDQFDSRELAVEFTIPESFASMIDPFIDQVFKALNAWDASTKKKTPKEKAGVWVDAVEDELKGQAKDALLEKVGEWGGGTALYQAAAGKATEAADKLKGKMPEDLGSESENKMKMALKFDILNSELIVELVRATERKLTLPGIEASLNTSKSGGEFKKKIGKKDVKK